MHQVLGYALAAAIGLSLGLLGGGGSILPVPIFVFVMGSSPKLAIAMSLPVVGATSLVGAFGHWRAGTFNLGLALDFGAVAMVGAIVAARLSSYVPGVVQLTLLGLVMLVSATLMLRPPAVPSPGGAERPAQAAGLARHPLLVGVTGLGVGM